MSKDDFNVKAIIQSTFGTHPVAHGCNGYIGGLPASRPTPKDKDAEARGYMTDRPTPGVVVLKGI